MSILHGCSASGSGLERYRAINKAYATATFLGTRHSTELRGAQNLSCRGVVSNVQFDHK